MAARPASADSRVATRGRPSEFFPSISGAKGPFGNKLSILARAPRGQMRGAATKAMSDIVEEPELRSGRAPFPPSETGPLALLLAPYIPPRVLLVARASPAGLGASSKVYR